MAFLLLKLLLLIEHISVRSESNVLSRSLLSPGHNRATKVPEHLRYLESSTARRPYNASSLISRNQTQTIPEFEKCQSSRASWSDWQSTTTVFWTTIYRTVTFTYAPLLVEEVYGTASAYTTIAGIPHVRGTSFKATSIRTHEVQIPPDVVSGFGTLLTTKTLTTRATFLPSPTCTIPESQCSVMWKSYLRSLGQQATDLASATEPSITPVPFNRPRCSIAPLAYKCAEVAEACLILAFSAQLFYWPSTGIMTAGSDRKMPIYATHKHHTFTYPSVYLEIHNITAEASAWCTWSSPLGAPTTEMYNFGDTVLATQSIADIVTALHSSDISTIVWNLASGIDRESAARAVSRIGFQELDLAYPDLYRIEPAVWANLTQPTAIDYYLKPGGELECAPYGPSPACHYIFDDLYAPWVSLPPILHDLDPVFRGCPPMAFDVAKVYDPPSALTPAAVAASPTLPQPGSPTGESSATLSSSEPAQTSSSSFERSASAKSLPSASLPVATATSPLGSSLLTSTDSVLISLSTAQSGTTSGTNPIATTSDTDFIATVNPVTIDGTVLTVGDAALTVDGWVWSDASSGLVLDPATSTTLLHTEPSYSLDSPITIDGTILSDGSQTVVTVNDGKVRVSVGSGSLVLVSLGGSMSSTEFTTGPSAGRVSRAHTETTSGLIVSTAGETSSSPSTTTAAPSNGGLDPATTTTEIPTLSLSNPPSKGAARQNRANPRAWISVLTITSIIVLVF